MPQLDAYNSSQIDDEAYAPLEMGTRMQVDAALNRRDQEALRRQGRIPDIFLPDYSTLRTVRTPPPAARCPGCRRRLAARVGQV